MKQPKSIQISIPKPCTEDWSKMTPQQHGRFCDSCQKCVVDFTGFTDEQLLNYIKKNKNSHLCGRFNSTQLDRRIFTPQSRRSYFQWMISLGLVIVLTDFFATDAMAQSTSGKIVGVIHDENNNYIPNVLVQISEGGLVRDSVYTNKEGEYVTKKLVPGRYTIYI